MARMGMDADQVASAGKALKERAAEIDALVGKLEGIVRSIPGVWEGPDAQQFVNEWWPEHKKTLVAASSHVAGLGQSALNNASEQREVSGSNSGGLGTSLPGIMPHGGDSAAPVENGSVGSSAGTLPPGGGRDAYLARFGDVSDEHVDGLGAYSGNCTSWAAYRRQELGLSWPSPTGMGDEMAGKAGGSVSTPPTLGAIVSTTASNHVMIVEQIYPDGSFRVSEMNVGTAASNWKPVLGATDTTRVFHPAGNGQWTNGKTTQQLVVAP